MKSGNKDYRDIHWYQKDWVTESYKNFITLGKLSNSSELYFAQLYDKNNNIWISKECGED